MSDTDTGGVEFPSLAIQSVALFLHGDSLCFRNQMNVIPGQCQLLFAFLPL